MFESCHCIQTNLQIQYPQFPTSIKKRIKKHDIGAHTRGSSFQYLHTAKPTQTVQSSSTRSTRRKYTSSLWPSLFIVQGQQRPPLSCEFSHIPVTWPHVPSPMIIVHQGFLRVSLPSGLVSDTTTYSISPCYCFLC